MTPDPHPNQAQGPQGEDFADLRRTFRRGLGVLFLVIATPCLWFGVQAKREADAERALREAWNPPTLAVLAELPQATEELGGRPELSEGGVLPIRLEQRSPTKGWFDRPIFQALPEGLRPRDPAQPPRWALTLQPYEIEARSYGLGPRGDLVHRRMGLVFRLYDRAEGLVKVYERVLESDPLPESYRGEATLWVTPGQVVAALEELRTP